MARKVLPENEFALADTVEEHFQMFLRGRYGEGVLWLTKAQKRELREAFYCGWAHQILFVLSVNDPVRSSAESVHQLNEINGVMGERRYWKYAEEKD